MRVWVCAVKQPRRRLTGARALYTALVSGEFGREYRAAERSARERVTQRADDEARRRGENCGTQRRLWATASMDDDLLRISVE